MSEVHQRQRAQSVDDLTLALFAKFDPFAFVVASAAVGALIMFFATAVLLLAGAAPGQSVGPNLSAFATFLPGYAVSWPGAVVGALYAGVAAGLVGFALAVFWNFSHIVVVGLAVLRRGALEYD